MDKVKEYAPLAFYAIGLAVVSVIVLRDPSKLDLLLTLLIKSPLDIKRQS